MDDRKPGRGTVERGCEEETRDGVSRRTCLQLAGTLVGATTAIASVSNRVRGGTSGYGEGGYGEGGYGGSSDTAVAVSTDGPTNLTSSSATLNGSLDSLGGATSADCYFEYRESASSSWTATSVRTLSSTGSFSVDVSGLASCTDYEYRAVADASDGDTDAGGTVTFTSECTSSAPTVDTYVVTEAGKPNPHATITADWAVSDADGDLNAVLVEVFDSTGVRLDSARTNVDGGSASGIDEFKIKFANNETFDVRVTVGDDAGNTTVRTETVSS